eukprot:4360769-Pyramimonas_sp.AAC.1
MNTNGCRWRSCVSFAKASHSVTFAHCGGWFAVGSQGGSGEETCKCGNVKMVETVRRVRGARASRWPRCRLRRKRSGVCPE